MNDQTKETLILFQKKNPEVEVPVPERSRTASDWGAFPKAACDPAGDHVRQAVLQKFWMSPDLSHESDSPHAHNNHDYHRIVTVKERGGG